MIRIGDVVVVTAAMMLVSPVGRAAVVDLTFEGINAAYPTTDYAQILDFYDGGASNQGTSGPNYGVSFSANAEAICLNTPGIICSNASRGGLGDPSSQEGALFFTSGTQAFMNVAAGFSSGLSFEYAAPLVTGSVSVYSGISGTGTLLATLSLPVDDSGVCGPPYNAAFCPFSAEAVTFEGTAHSVSFAGPANLIVFDDVTFGGASPPPSGLPEPSSLSAFAAALAGLSALRRYRADAITP